MFSVQQKRDISDAVQKILRATAHPELPTTGEVSFKLHVDGAEEWSFADIQNNAAVGNPGLNPHNELMDSLPEEEARSLISKAQDLPLPDPRDTPDDFIKEMLTTQLAKLQRSIVRLEDRDKIKDQLFAEMSDALSKVLGYITPITEDNLIGHHGEQITKLKDRLDSLVKAVEGFAQEGVAMRTKLDTLQNEHHAHEIRITQIA